MTELSLAQGEEFFDKSVIAILISHCRSETRKRQAVQMTNSFSSPQLLRSWALAALLASASPLFQ